jgi:tRNA pseudouridine55 synthase
MDGLLVVDKPSGMSSHDAVSRARRALREKRIGHTGTLDPLATGVLVLCVGSATRLSEYLLGEDKAYEGLIKLGERTDTDDAEGRVIDTRPVPPLTDQDLRALESRFTGEIAQVPPQFSAIQKDGQRAYALARQGQAVALAPRRVRIDALRLALVNRHSEAPSDGATWLAFSVRCSAGTYIRALARDIGEALGCGAHVASLRRTAVGPFTLADAITLPDLEEAARAGRVTLLPMDRALANWPAVTLDEQTARRLKQGQRIALPDLRAQPAAKVRVYDANGCFFAVASWDGTVLKPTKVLDAALSVVR